jgi:hypothetical protein
MDKDAGKNTSGWEIRRQERNLSFVIGSRAYMFQEEYVLYREENNKNIKKNKKGPKNSYNTFWIVRKEH